MEWYLVKAQGWLYLYLYLMVLAFFAVLASQYRASWGWIHHLWGAKWSSTSQQRPNWTWCQILISTAMLLSACNYDLQTQWLS